MSKKANNIMIGIFVVGAAMLLVVSILAFGSGAFFRNTVKYVLFFDTSTKGLSIGSSVIFRGVKVGYVKDISLIYDEKNGLLLIPVIIEVDPTRLKGAPTKDGAECIACTDYTLLVKQGLRAKLVLQSFLTGELVVAFDFYQDRPAVLRNITKQYPELPTLPLEGISENVESTLAGINKFINSENVQESLLELRDALREVNQSARYFRLLVEYLEEHPEAILKGKQFPKENRP